MDKKSRNEIVFSICSDDPQKLEELVGQYGTDILKEPISLAKNSAFTDPYQTFCCIDDGLELGEEGTKHKPLFLAVGCGSKKVIKYILGSDIDILDTDSGGNILHCFIKTYYERHNIRKKLRKIFQEVLKHVNEKAPRPNPDDRKTQADIKAVEENDKLLESIFKTENEDGYYPLELAAHFGLFEICQLIIDTKHIYLKDFRISGPGERQLIYDLDEYTLNGSRVKKSPLFDIYDSLDIEYKVKVEILDDLKFFRQGRFGDVLKETINKKSFKVDLFSSVEPALIYFPIILQIALIVLSSAETLSRNMEILMIVNILSLIVFILPLLIFGILPRLWRVLTLPGQKLVRHIVLCLYYAIQERLFIQLVVYITWFAIIWDTVMEYCIANSVVASGITTKFFQCTKFSTSATSFASLDDDLTSSNQTLDSKYKIPENYYKNSFGKISYLFLFLIPIIIPVYIKFLIIIFVYIRMIFIAFANMVYDKPIVQPLNDQNKQDYYFEGFLYQIKICIKVLMRFTIFYLFLGFLFGVCIIFTIKVMPNVFLLNETLYPELSTLAKCSDFIFKISHGSGDVSLISSLGKAGETYTFLVIIQLVFYFCLNVMMLAFFIYDISHHLEHYHTFKETYPKVENFIDNVQFFICKVYSPIACIRRCSCHCNGEKLKYYTVVYCYDTELIINESEFDHESIDRDVLNYYDDKYEKSCCMKSYECCHKNRIQNIWP